MIILFPVGAFAYFFVVKNRAGGKTGSSSIILLFVRKLKRKRPLQLKQLIGKQFNKAFHYEKLGQTYSEQKKFDLAIPQFEEAINAIPKCWKHDTD